MAKQHIDHRGIRFGIAVHTGGYAWQRVPYASTELDVLAPADLTRTTETGGIAITGGVGGVRSTLGLGVARKAFTGFRKLAETIARWEVMDDEPIVDPAGNTGFVTGLPKLTTDPGECMRLIVEYANAFGTLWGDNDPRTLRSWQREASQFLALRDIARAVRPGADTREFEARVYEVYPDGDGQHEGAQPTALEYVSRRPQVPIMVIARAGQRIESRRAVSALSEATDYFDFALSGSPRVRARMLLSRQVNRKLAGGLSWWASPLKENVAAVVPHRLVDLLYLRLWLDTVEGDDLERQRTCLNCGRELVGTARKKYCDDACRTEYHNRRRARSG